MADETKEEIARLTAKFDEIKGRIFPGADAVTVAIRQKEQLPIQQVIVQLGIVTANVSDTEKKKLSELIAGLQTKLTQTMAAGSEPDFLGKLGEAAKVAREYMTLASGRSKK